MEEEESNPVRTEDADSGAELSPEARAAYRDRLLDTMERMELEYDKALLVLHPLGISVTSALFVSLLNAKTEIPNRSLLFISWSIWTLGVIFILASFAVSAKLQQVAIKEWEDRKNPNKNPLIKNLGIWNAITTYGSGILFVIGICVAAVFLIRLPLKKCMAEDNKRGEHFEKGSSLAPPPKPLKTPQSPQPSPQTAPKESPKK